MFSGVATNSFYYRIACQNPVPRYTWQIPTQSSRLEIASEIATAELEVAEYLGYNLAPDFLTHEIVDYPSEYLVEDTPGWWGLRGQKAVLLNRGKIISGGARAVSLVDTVSAGDGLAYSDPDGDGFSEVATISVATALTDVSEVQVFYSGHGGAPEYEIGKPFYASISGGVYTAKFYIWQLIDPDVDAGWPDEGGFVATDMTESANLVSSIDLYRVYVDTTESYVRIFAQDNYYLYPDQVRGTDGVFAIHDSERGWVIPTPATYDAGEGVWNTTSCALSGPTRVRVSYYSGDISQAFLARRTVDPLKDEYARAVAYIATARLKQPPCPCPEPLHMYQYLSEDMARFARSGGFLMTRTAHNSEFGTRVGEVEAWKMINRTHEPRAEAAII